MTAHVNGAHIAPSVNDDVVRVLAKALAEAKRGEWQACALLLCPHADNVAVSVAGLTNHEFALNFGADLVKANIVAATMAPKPSSIVRADPSILQG